MSYLMKSIITVCITSILHKIYAEATLTYNAKLSIALILNLSDIIKTSGLTFLFNDTGKE